METSPASLAPKLASAPVLQPVTSISSHEMPKAAVMALTSAEPLGATGALLSQYHVGDLTGLIGLLLTWLTFRQARAAKAAAKEAATAAIRSRDKVEIATRLIDLAHHLRVIRDVYRTDDWSYLDTSKDRAVALAVEVRATFVDDLDLVNLMSSIEAALRQADPVLDHIKEEEKRHAVRSRFVTRVSRFADSVDLVRLKQVKHGT